MPFPTASNHDFSFDGRLAATAAWREEFVEIEVAVEAQAGVAVVDSCVSVNGIRGVEVGGASFDAGEAGVAGGGGLGVEGDAFEKLGTVVAGEAVGMEALGSGGDDTAGDWEGAKSALGCGAAVEGGPVRN